MRKDRPQRYDTVYWSSAGTLMVLAEDFVVLIRMSDGLCRRFSYEELGV